MTVRSRYRPGEERLLLGGDFLDVAITPSGTVAFCIGDVGGHGAMPAAVGASLRAGWRALTLTGDDPIAWLVGCADVLASSDPPDELFVTMTTGFVRRGSSSPHAAVSGTSVTDPSRRWHGPDAGSQHMSAPGPVLQGRARRAGARRSPERGDADHVHRWTVRGVRQSRPARAARSGSHRALVRRSRPAPLDENRLDALLAYVEDANGGPVGDDIGVLALAGSIGTLL